MTKIPLIGIVGLNKESSDLAVLQTKIGVIRIFRAIRSSLQFLYKQQNLDGQKTLSPLQ
jgi:hypothetical protein